MSGAFGFCFADLRPEDSEWAVVGLVRHYDDVSCSWTYEYGWFPDGHTRTWDSSQPFVSELAQAVIRLAPVLKGCGKKLWRTARSAAYYWQKAYEADTPRKMKGYARQAFRATLQIKYVLHAADLWFDADWSEDQFINAVKRWNEEHAQKLVMTHQGL